MDFLVKSTYEKNMKERNFKMKKFRKLIVAVMAMALALGMLTMTASAAEDTVKVTVIWADAAGADTSLYGWEGVDLGGWPGTAMTKVNDTTYTLDITPAGDTCMLIPYNANGQTVDLGPVDLTKGDITITIGAKGDDGKYTAEVVVDSAAGGVGAGDATPIAVVAVIALVAAAGVVVCAKRRAVTE